MCISCAIRVQFFYILLFLLQFAIVKQATKKTVKSITLKPEVVDPEDIEMLQDLIIAAHHDAMTKIQENIKAKYGPLLNGMNIPGL